MADLIDRQKIKAIFEPWLKVKDYSEGELNMLKAVLYEITIMPSEERHGEWILKQTGGEPFYTCSKCGFIAWENEDTNYCPNCGVEMYIFEGAMNPPEEE